MPPIDIDFILQEINKAKVYQTAVNYGFII